MSFMILQKQHTWGSLVFQLSVKMLSANHVAGFFDRHYSMKESVSILCFLHGENN